MKKQKSVVGRISLLSKYWIIGLALYILLVMIFSNQSKDGLLQVIGALLAIGMGWLGLYKYVYDKINSSLFYCETQARLNCSEYVRNGVLSKILSKSYAQARLSEKYLNGVNIEIDDQESLYWAREAYKKSNAYVEGYTVIRSKET